MLSYTKTRFHEIRVRLEHHVSTSRLNGFLWELFLFGFKQGWACLFGATILSLVLGFGLVALFIWAAENVGTFAAVWVYPHQRNGWQLVRFGKYGSWLLLMIISFILVSLVHRPRSPEVEVEASEALA